MTRESPVITTPSDRRNGKRWWTETWGKAIGSVMAGLLLAVIWWSWGVAVAFHAATVEVYSLPPRVSALESKVYTPASPMPQTEIDRLAQAIAAALAKKSKGETK